MQYHAIHKATDPSKDSAIRTVRLHINLIKQAIKLSETSGKSLNGVLVEAIKAGLPDVERGTIK